ncbi:hypothetical protein [Duganella violaceipulchra]|uniref:Uncharacterized protein n=1 Tax=Duganella violaceipulchra TaxID=2849652 RepID=A0AA41HBN3_9BURK|nr:hypothetical protein [Duganella violaceicalia]MBV6324299.1 hypothetical protein [Duganella violaceicalia]MCP2007312.1 hypothetical protein [Duganella violaceicalia]
MFIAKRLFLIFAVLLAAAAIWKGGDWLTRPQYQAAPLSGANPTGHHAQVALAAAATATVATGHTTSPAQAEDHVEDMVRVAAGDPGKSFEAFNKIEECLTLEKDKEIVNDVDFKFTWQDAGVTMETVKHKAGEPALQVLRRICAGLSGRTRLDRFHLLNYAADKGVPGALAGYIFAGPEGDRAALKERPDDPAVIKWRADALRRLDERIAQGYPDALLLGASGYAELGKIMTSADMCMEHMAVNRVLGAINSSEGIYPKALLDIWAKDLSEQQKSDAEAQAERIFLNWKRRQTAPLAPVAVARQ